MCPFLGLFVVGHVMIGPNHHLIEVLEEGEIVSYVIPSDVFTECSQSPSYFC